MSKLSIILLFILTVCIVMSNLSSVESTRNDSESTEHRIQKRIVGGHYTNKYKDTVFGLQLDLYYRLLFVLPIKLDSRFCTGTFIAPNAILTAAHCCVNVESSTVSVYNAHHQTFKVAVRKYHINPDYKSGASNHDIAIIKLTENISRIIPAKLDYTEVECQKTVWLYGYGYTKFNQAKVSINLKELPAKVAECSWFTRGPSDNHMIITHAKNGSTCHGDSGGPMFNQNGTVVGVNSGTALNCSPNEENYAVRVSSHKHFIQTSLHQNSASAILKLNSSIFLILITFYDIY